MKRRNSHLINEEVSYSASEELVSTTDLRGVVTYANDAFCKIAGYSNDELVGKNHNIVRHPDMPAAAFADLWQKLKKGESWRGIVKNRCKDGRYYWVDAFVTPIFQQDKLVGYQSVRVKPDSQTVKRAELSYPAMLAGKIPSDWRSNFGAKRLLAVLLSVTVIAAGSWFFGAAFLLAALLPLIFLLCFYDELLVIPNKLQQQKQQFDSVSRWIYSGFGPFGIADFHNKMLQARLRTVLGRTLDSTTALSHIAESQTEAVKLTEQGVAQQQQQLIGIATAIHQLNATVQDIASRTVDTNQHVAATHAICEAAKQAMQQTASTV